ncbi:MAG: HD domain-containing protein, partial [Halioglobus sp.]|nr:HD domain-containing protein [Halioglobus sp.]
MGQFQRAGHMDVSNTVDVTDAANVQKVVGSLLLQRYSALNSVALQRLFVDFERLYGGRYPGFRACDIQYHNAQHVLDVTLAMARLLDGHAREHDASECLSADMALAGIATALFHDSGYIRRTRDTRHHNGAAYTRVHVSRGARFLRDFLPEAGLERIAPVCTRIIHYTGYEREPEEFVLEDPGEHLLGMLLGTADLMAQMADSNYLHKCREHLYQE